MLLLCEGRPLKNHYKCMGACLVVYLRDILVNILRLPLVPALEGSVGSHCEELSIYC